MAVVASMLSCWRIKKKKKKLLENKSSHVLQQKLEKEKLEKLARKGSKPGDDPASHSLDTTDVKLAGSSPGSSTAGVSSDQNKNYAVIAGTIVAVSALGWYLLSKPNKSEYVSK